MTAPNGASSAPKTLLRRRTVIAGRKKTTRVKNVLLVNALLVILFLSDTHGGRVHDLRIAEATPYPLPAGSGLLQDLGFLSFTLPQVEILMPTKKPRGEELSLEQQLANQALHQRRLRIEHVNSSVKRCRIVKDRFACGRRASVICDGTLLCPAQLPGAPDPVATDDLIGINSNVLLSGMVYSPMRLASCPSPSLSLVCRIPI